MELIAEIFTEIFIRSWFGSAIRHIGAGLRYGCLLANGFLGFLVLAVILILITK